ncbi:RNA-binding S4 domain-containing protein [Demequina sp. NBRC 110055]|uniref:RNA-binding S4 domain-containing protein n=1 Tax=Demequina sp. NBRC 110055 TaxID=1570344 RepID=UPI00190ED0E0|nr:RNA-binding S4 domain-containing protein [Demequina sp. NBRC 110055]
MARPQPIDDVSKGEGVLRLGQFLQMAGLVDSGGEAKEVIREGLITVNGEVDERRGRQLAVGDVVAFGGRRARVAE